MKHFSILLALCYEHYISDSTKPDLANLCRMIVTIGEDFSGEGLHYIPSKGRNRMIGEIITKAVEYDDDRKSGKTPMSNKVVYSMVNQVFA